MLIALKPCSHLLLLLIFSISAFAQTNAPTTAEIQGQELAAQLRSLAPAQSFTNTGRLKIRDRNGLRTTVPFRFETIVTPTNWLARYQVTGLTNATYTLTHADGRRQWRDADGQPCSSQIAFAGSDFLLADLGLEFFAWPQQKILPNPTNLKRGRSFTLLESACSTPTTGGYARVRCWIDRETGGILQAEAYDTDGKLLKEFEPKSFKKVAGQWQLQEMEIRNSQTGSRTRLEFDLPR